MTAFIVAAKRAAVAPRMGALAHLEFHDLAAPIIQQILVDAGLHADQVDEVIVSNALGAGGNPARVVSLAAGLPDRVAGLSIDRQCVGGLDAILLAKALIESGQAEVVIAGGVESYSRRPIRMRKTQGHGPLEAYDRPPFTPWADRDPDLHVSADELATKFGVSREEQDVFARHSHAKAVAAQNELSGEIVEIEDVRRDTYSRLISEALCKRAPILHGSVTFANSAVAADGAAFCVVVSERMARLTSGHVVEILDGATIGDDPSFPALAPVHAVQTVLKRQGLGASDVDAVEMMEAYAVQAMLCLQELGFDPAQANQKGGALARGHPIGASGAILATRLFHDLNGSPTLGLAAIAAAGGLGSAVLLRSY